MDQENNSISGVDKQIFMSYNLNKSTKSLRNNVNIRKLGENYGEGVGVQTFSSDTDNSHTVIDGSGYKKSSSAALRELEFAIRHPVIALEIGKVEEGMGVNNISTNATRFAGNDLGLSSENSKDGKEQGSQINSFRHVLWIGTIAKRYGAGIAKEVGDAHEEHPDAIENIADLSKVRYQTLDLADEVIDLLNDGIGR